VGAQEPCVEKSSYGVAYVEGTQPTIEGTRINTPAEYPYNSFLTAYARVLAHFNEPKLDMRQLWGCGVHVTLVYAGVKRAVVFQEKKYICAGQNHESVSKFHEVSFKTATGVIGVCN
jgi:hypothetical protein